MSPSQKNWANVEGEIDRIVADSGSLYDSKTISNVKDFVESVRDRCPVPIVSRGYWNTICFDWEVTTNGPLQIEVFGNRLEVYRFKPAFNVWYETHAPGQKFSSKFFAELPPK